MIPVVTTLSSTLNIKTDRLLIAIAYGATIGGMLTPIGTPANLVAVDYANAVISISI